MHLLLRGREPRRPSQLAEETDTNGHSARPTWAQSRIPIDRMTSAGRLACAEVGEAERLEQPADIALVVFGAEALGHDRLKVDTPPAHDAIGLRIGAGLDDRRQLGQLRLAQTRRAAPAVEIEKTLRITGRR